MKIKDIAEKNPKELVQMVTDQRTKLASLRVDLRTGKVPNIKEIASVRRSIAQALTIQRQRELTDMEATMNEGPERNEGESNG